MKTKSNQLFIDIMDIEIDRKKVYVDKHLDNYLNNLEFVNLVSFRLQAKQDAEKICEAGGSMQARYFAYAMLFMQVEEYEYVHKCVQVIDIISTLVCDAIRMEYKTCNKKQVNEMCEGYILGIAELKQALANDNLFSEESRLYE